MMFNQGNADPGHTSCRCVKARVSYTAKMIWTPLFLSAEDTAKEVVYILLYKAAAYASFLSLDFLG